MGSVTEGRFSSGLPYLRLGEGPPLIVSPGLSSEHANPTGLWRRMALSWAGPFADHFTVYLTQRRPGLASVPAPLSCQFRDNSVLNRPPRAHLGITLSLRSADFQSAAPASTPSSPEHFAS